ncbi:MAG TPA: hypothetical protein PKM50_07975 [Methanoregula sp.]|nr:hypothetical protein [Methanoregula sp.]
MTNPPDHTSSPSRPTTIPHVPFTTDHVASLSHVTVIVLIGYASGLAKD